MHVFAKRTLRSVPARSDRHRAPVIERPVGVMGDFPDVPFRVSKGSRRAAPLGVTGWSPDRATGPFGGGQDLAHLLRRAHVVGELNAGRPMTPERRPEAEHHAAGLEEADFIVGQVGAGPSERLVEGAFAREVTHAEGDQTDPLLHWTEHSI